MRLGVYGASGRQGTRYLNPENWPSGIECFSLARDAKPSGDGIIVATPPATHAAFVAQSAGFPVLLEKPMALTWADTNAIAHHAEPLLVAHTHLWSEYFLALEPSPGAIVRWCGPERTDGSCPALLDWGPHAWSMAIKLGTDRVTTGFGDRDHNFVQSRGRFYPPLNLSSRALRDQLSLPPKPMREMLASFATLIRGGQDWRADMSFALAVQRKCLTPSAKSVVSHHAV